jgi:hypothetical protein
MRLLIYIPDCSLVFRGVHDILLDIAKKSEMWLLASSLLQGHEPDSVHPLIEPRARKPVSATFGIDHKNMAKPAPTRPSAMLIWVPPLKGAARPV